MAHRLVFPVGLLLCFVLPALGQGEPQASYEEGTRSWTLTNGLVEAQFRLLPSNEFRLIALGRPGGKQWIANGRPAVSPIHLNIDGLVLNAAARWELVDTRVEDADRRGLRQVIQLRNDEAKAEVTLRAEVHPGQPFLRLQYGYRNQDEKRHWVRDARFLNLRLNPELRPVRVFYVDQYRQGTQLMFEAHEYDLQEKPDAVVNMKTGAYADQCTWLALRDSQDNGLVFGWEFNGRSTVRAELIRGSKRLDINSSPQNLFAGVAAGGELSLPASFVGLFEGDWDEGGYRTQRYVETVLAQPLPGANFPYLMYNTWGYGQQLNEQTLRRAAQIAAQIGVELFVVDLGWARQIGDWEEEGSKFPSGLSRFADYVRSLGMKFGLHFVPVEASAAAPVLVDNPDWASTTNNEYFEAQSICISNRLAQEWLRRTARSIVDRYQPDWITQDAENLVKECTKATHTHHPRNSNWANSVNGLDSFIQYMRAQAPSTLWENNADGGTMSTYEAVKHYATASGCDACEVLPRRQATWGMSYPFSPRYISRYMGEAPTKFTTRSSMFGGPWILMQPLHILNQSQVELLRQEAAIYKTLRSLIREGKVYHLLGRPTGFQIEAIESFHPEWDRGVIFVYRPETPGSSQAILPKGLRSGGRYRVTFQESRDVVTDSGANLMRRGINVRLPSRNFAEIVYITGL